MLRICRFLETIDVALNGILENFKTSVFLKNFFFLRQNIRMTDLTHTHLLINLDMTFFDSESEDLRRA